MGRFHELMGDLVPEAEQAARQQAGFEERTVLALCRRFQVPGKISDLREACRQATGSAWLQLQWWELVYPSFPYHLAARTIPYAYKVSAADWLQRLTRTVLFQEWEDIVDQIPREQLTKPVGMVFEWPTFQTTAIMYNACPNWDADADVGGMFRKLQKVGFFTVEPLVGFLSGLTWSP